MTVARQFALLGRARNTRCSSPGVFISCFLKRAGNDRDAHEYLKAFAKMNDAQIGPDDITVE
jgi:hypothetical protein